MKKIYNVLAAGVFALMTLNSCDEPYAAWGEETGEGQLSTKDFVLNVANEDATRATTRDVNEFTVKITDVVKKTDKSWKYGEMPGVITLPVGNYHIEAYNEEPKDADWDAPYYYKDTTITITRDKMESLGAVLCKLCNVKVTVKYDAKLRSLLSDDAKVTVMAENNPNKSLVYALEHADNESAGYFKHDEGAKTMVMTFTGTVKGTPVTAYSVKTDVNPGEHHIVTFSLKDTPGIPGESGYIGGSGMSINTTVTVVDLNNNLDPGNDPLDPYEMLEVSKNKLTVKAEGGNVDFTVSAKGTSGWFITGAPEWLSVTPTSGMSGTETAKETKINITAEANTNNEARTATLNVRMARKTVVVTVTQSAAGTPDVPQPSEDMPTITSTTVELNTPIDISNVTSENPMPFTVDMAAPNGFKNIFVEIDSPRLTPEELRNMGLAESFDLANPGEYAEGLSGLGFPVGDEVLGQVKTQFNITDFVPLIPILGSGKSVFKITVVDSKDQKATADLIMVVK
ncbi:MAG: DUF4493 domain-containing protein [Muribaculaceae bacterium]|nr:DUF4493 domain-containing protein [Muribaculaceae bacterium]